jgi:hypothetical protein
MPPWQPWPPQLAAQLFLEELNCLTDGASPTAPTSSMETAYA